MSPEPTRTAQRTPVLFRPRAFRRVALALGAALAAAALAWFGNGAFEARQAARASGETALRVVELRGSIVHLDELLTMSARMSAASGDPRWRARYEEAEPRLDAAIQEALALAPAAVRHHLAATTDTANRRLVEIEHQAFDLVAAGAHADAARLLDGGEYERLKRTYSDGMQAFVTQLEAITAAQAAAEDRRAWLEAGALAVLAAFVVAVILALDGRSRLRAALARTELAARTDPLTGLWNRRGFAERLDAALAQMRSAGVRDRAWPVAVLLIDLDRFKAVNDIHGHDAGDRLLAEVARRIRAHTRAADAIARLGGDEFAVVATAATAGLGQSEVAAEMAATMAERIVEAVSQPIEVAPGVTARVGASIGVAIAPTDGTGASELLRAADVAMYSAKADGRGRTRLFEPQLDARARARAELEARLRRAVEAGRVVPHFQPLVSLGGARRVVGLEVLARWHDAERGPVPPAEFIPVAEEAGLIGPLTTALLRRACRAVGQLPDALPISLNVSPVQLRDRGFPAAVLAVLAEEGLAPCRLQVEVTETALMGDLALAREVLQELSAAGVEVALDDFGTGYSSLRHLKALPIDRLKVDASFVRTMAEDAESRKIVAAVLGLGQSLGLVTVAEGIEDDATCAMLAQMGCDVGQGWLFGRPLPEAELAAHLRRLDEDRAPRPRDLPVPTNLGHEA